MIRKLIFLFVLASVSVNSAIAQFNQPFVVNDIRVEGLQRISAGSVFTSMPINVGDTVNSTSISSAIRALFRTGNFDDIKIGRDNNVLVVTVVERPSISEIILEGNEVIDTDSLLDGLKGAGLSEGQVFKRSTLEGMKMELTRQYVSQGRYDADIDTEVVSLPRNRVAININIDEGTSASIKNISLIGNDQFDDDALLKLFSLRTTGFWSWITGDDKYAKEKLSGDLEELSSFYLDRGYINFKVDSSQVSVSPDREAVYITVNVIEGDVYEVGEVDLSGDLVLEEKFLRPFVFIKKGQTFSQQQVTSTEEWLTKRLGNEGYNFAKVEGIPEINEEEKTVDLKFFINPGNRTYVRQIKFSGNAKTSDEVMRREMRQMESAPASSAAIEQSRIRLDRLGYFKETKVDTKEVATSDDLIDLEYIVEEQPSGSIGASVGFSQDSGLIFGANIQQDNFLGTGRRIGVGLNRSDFQSSIRFSFVNPYYTPDGVSRGFSVFYRETDLEEVNVSSYTTNTLGVNLNFGYPIKETQRLNFSVGWANTEIETGQNVVQEIERTPRLDQFDDIISIDGFFEDQEIIENNLRTGFFSDTEVFQPLSDLDLDALTEFAEPGFLDINGNEFETYTFTIAWSENTLNRGRLATRGYSQTLSLESTIPGSDVEFYKLGYSGQIFFPLTRSLTLRLRTELGYGDGFGDTDELPFFENYFAGGFGSVRGYKSNTLGPQSTPALFYDFRQAVTDIVTQAEADADPDDDLTDESVGLPQQFGDLGFVLDPVSGNLRVDPPISDRDPFGGNVLIEGSAEILFPLPFIEDQRSIRTAFFIDAGNVFNSNCRDQQLNCFDVSTDELRYSYGVGLSWITGFGPLTFSLAKPINESEDDEDEAFQFTLGRSF